MTEPKSTKPCIDCMKEWNDKVFNDSQNAPAFRQRPAPHSGPRCATHWRAELKRRKAANHDRMVSQTYGLERGEYEKLYNFQGGLCALCRRANGKAKRLAVDHDHNTGEPRGLLCGPCNKMLGHGRDQLAFFRRVIDYLSISPYKLMKDYGRRRWPVI